ncbi:MAG: UDP-N-acetylmuramoyl-tripeptide--D-alanyl-D-alanine ligase [Kiritimatiellae bacterium]|nr:UDP-N-acetylmuramoyl-tripeptide--D-alanyl-D-alanine ligase [Kiritimatiellia bacterium]
MLAGAEFDSRKIKPGMLFIALKGEKADGHDFIPQALKNGASGIIDGYDELDRIARERRRSLKAKVVAVTGSAGKTTTKELLKTFLSCVGKTYATGGNFNNHIGLPYTILNCPEDADFLVLEMGTNHPGEIEHLCSIAEPDSGVITNIGSAHIEFFGSREGIAREKGRLLANVKDFGVVSNSCFALDILKDLALDRKLYLVAPDIPQITEAMIEVLPGKHNISNASLAFELASHYGLKMDQAIRALADFSLPGARWRRSEKDGVKYIDDTYNANPESMIAALDAFVTVKCTSRHIAILGDMFELGDRTLEYHREVFDHAHQLNIDLIVAVGKTSANCKASMYIKDAGELKEILPKIVQNGDLVLLKASNGMKLGEALNW